MIPPDAAWLVGGDVYRRASCVGSSSSHLTVAGRDSCVCTCPGEHRQQLRRRSKAKQSPDDLNYAVLRTNLLTRRATRRRAIT